MKKLNLLFILFTLLFACKKEEPPQPKSTPTYDCQEAFFNYTIDGVDKTFNVCGLNESVLSSVSYDAEALKITAGHKVGYDLDTAIVLNIYLGNAVGTYQLLSSGSQNLNSYNTTVYTDGAYYTYYETPGSGQIYKTNNGTSGTVNITRYDGVYNGFTEGNFDMIVKNTVDGTTKTITGSFRLKIKWIN